MLKKLPLEPLLILSAIWLAIARPAPAQVGPVPSLDWEEIQAEIDVGRFEEARANLTDFVARNPEHQRLGNAIYYLAYLEADPARRNQALQRFLTRFPRHSLAPAAVAELARYQQIVGNTEQAASEWQKLRLNYRDDPLAGDALYWLGIIALERRDYRAARETFLSLFRDFPAHPKEPWGHVAVGDSYFLEGEYKDAAAAYVQSLALFPAPDLAADLNLRLGQTCERLGDIKKAMACYTLILDGFPASLDAPVARQRLRRLQSRGQNLDLEDRNQSTTDSTITVVAVDSTASDSLQPNLKYGLQLGAFLRYANAADLTRKLQASGYEIQIRRVNRDGRIQHLVILGSFDSLEQAREAGKEFTAREGLPYFITTY